MKKVKRRKRKFYSKGLQASRPRSSYASTDSWLNAIYRKHKEQIDNALAVEQIDPKTGSMLFDEEGNPVLEYPKNRRKAFKELVQGYIDEGLSDETALKKLQKSTIFTPVAERMKENLISGMKKHKVYNEFRNLNKSVSGKYLAFDRDRLRYDKDMGLYYYTTLEGKIIVIEWRNSPEVILIYELENDEEEIWY